VCKNLRPSRLRHVAGLFGNPRRFGISRGVGSHAFGNGKRSTYHISSALKCCFAQITPRLLGVGWAGRLRKNYPRIGRVLIRTLAISGLAWAKALPSILFGGLIFGVLDGADAVVFHRIAWGRPTRTALSKYCRGSGRSKYVPWRTARVILGTPFCGDPAFGHAPAGGACHDSGIDRSALFSPVLRGLAHCAHDTTVRPRILIALQIRSGMLSAMPVHGRLSAHFRERISIALPGEGSAAE
jgi:hypothetical protein